MKRMARRTLAVLIGLTLGWVVAGYSPSSMPGVGVSLAEDSGYTHSTTTEQAAEHREPQAAGEGEHHGEPEGPGPAAQLVPNAPKSQIAWYCSVLACAAGLFIAAIVIGIPSLQLRGPLPPDPADTHDDHDAHDDHGHDDHAHDSHDAPKSGGGGHH